MPAALAAGQPRSGGESLRPGRNALRTGAIHVLRVSKRSSAPMRSMTCSWSGVGAKADLHAAATEVADRRGIGWEQWIDRAGAHRGALDGLGRLAMRGTDGLQNDLRVYPLLLVSVRLEPRLDARADVPR